MDKGEIIIYQTEDGKSSLEVKLREDTVWLTNQQISLLFDRDRPVITKHINNIFKSNELDEKNNVQKMHIPNSDKMVKFYAALDNYRGIFGSSKRGCSAGSS